MPDATSQQPSARNRRSTFLRVGAGLLLAVCCAILLPPNRDSVLRQQVIQRVPELAAELGNGPWRLAGPAGPACESGFREAQQRRSTPVGEDPPILFTCTEKDGNILLSASAQTGDTRQAILKPVTGWSLFPPLAAILVAVLSGRLILALALAVLSGGFLSAPAGLSTVAFVLEAFRRAALDYVWTPLESSFQLYILGFTAALIGMVRVTSLSGGNLGIANLLAARAGGARSTRLAAFFMGLAIFFDDYANTIVVGTTLRPIADRFRVSREKLAYLVDSTAAPIAGVAVISTWIGYEVGLFGDLMADLRTGISGYQLFFSILPVRFYCLFTLLFVLASTWFRRDFGPMLRAERRAGQTGQVLRPGATPMVGRKNEEVAPAEGVEPAWWTAAIPVIVVVAGVILGMALDTLNHPEVRPVRLSESVFSVAYWTACFSYADNARVLFQSAILGSLLAILFAVTRRRRDTGKPAIGLPDALKAWVQGITGVWYAIAILILAWAIKEACTDVGTPTYLTAALSPLLSPGLLPVLIFLLASLVAFSIGTSWTTMAILIPTVVPLAYAMGGMPLTVLCAAAVLDGAIFGDHCSPISDTTVMSSIASSCDHLDHVRTQLPYALTTMAAAALFGYLGTALAYPWWVGFLLGWTALLTVLFAIGRDPDHRPDTPAPQPRLQHTP